MTSVGKDEGILFPLVFFLPVIFFLINVIRQSTISWFCFYPSFFFFPESMISFKRISNSHNPFCSLPSVVGVLRQLQSVISFSHKQRPPEAGEGPVSILQGQGCGSSISFCREACSHLGFLPLKLI